MCCVLLQRAYRDHQAEKRMKDLIAEEEEAGRLEDERAAARAAADKEKRAKKKERKKVCAKFSAACFGKGEQCPGTVACWFAGMPCSTGGKGACAAYPLPCSVMNLHCVYLHCVYLHCCV